MLIICCSMVGTVAVVWASQQADDCSQDAKEFSYMVAKRQLAGENVSTHFEPNTKTWCIIK